MADSAGVGSPQPGDGAADGYVQVQPQAPSTSPGDKFSLENSWEKCAAGLVVLKYLETALQVADMFTKQIFPKHFERLRRVMMGHENFDDMQARYVQVKASGDDMDDPKLYVDSKPGRPPK